MNRLLPHLARTTYAVIIISLGALLALHHPFVRVAGGTPQLEGVATAITRAVTHQPTESPDQADTPASADAPPPNAIPDTPLGRDLAAAIAAFADSETPMDPARLSQAFHNAVSAPQLKAVMDSVRGEYGRLDFVTLDAARSTDKLLVAACRSSTKGDMFRILIGHDDDGLVETFLLQPAPDLGADKLTDWADLDRCLAELPGTTSFGCYEIVESADNRSTAIKIGAVHGLNDETPLAIGSTFKLYILIALAELIDEGKAAWDEPLAVNNKYKSLPSGTMQTEVEGTTFPISHFAAKMISISDNTATDHLLHRVGRDRVEATMRRLNDNHKANTPFLSTREIFTLKLGQDRNLADRFIAASESEQAAMVAPDGPIAAGEPSMILAGAWLKPFRISRIEWFASARECAVAMAELNRIASDDDMKPLADALSLNPGLPLDDQLWNRFFYKGGSEPGVLNLTWLLGRNDGRTFALSIGFNNPDAAIDETKAISLAINAIQLLGETP